MLKILTGFAGWLVLDALCEWMGGEMPTKRPDGSLECWGGPEDGSYITAFAGSTLRRFPGGAYFMTKESGLVYWRWAEDSRRSA